MATIKFLIRNMDADNEQTIYITSRFGRNEKLMYATTLKVEPIFWDEKKERVRNSKYCLQRDDINAVISTVSARTSTFLIESARNGKPITKEALKNFLNICFGKEQGTATNFHSFFEQYIKECETRTNPNRGGQTVSYKTMREYARTYYYIQEYEKKRGIRLEFDNINKSFINDFIAFLQSLNLSTNTIGHKIVCIKALMRSANENDLTDNDKYQHFKNMSETSDNIALSEEELEKIAIYDFAANPRLERVRDMFLLGCWTGLRFSDLTSLREENIKDGKISLIQKKTDKPVVIPIHPVFNAIWKKYNGNLPPVISNQKFNEYLKRSL